MARIVPPCNSTRWRQIARPSPSPPCERVVVASICRKRIEDLMQMLGRDAAPGVADFERRLARFERAR